MCIVKVETLQIFFVFYAMHPRKVQCSLNQICLMLDDVSGKDICFGCTVSIGFEWNCNGDKKL